MKRTEKTVLDAACKKLLANKSILAPILKACVNEFDNCSVEEIEQKYIEGIPQIAIQAVYQDETVEFFEDTVIQDDISGDDEDENQIEGKSTVDSSVTEGTVTYDILFEAINPKVKEKLLTMIINVESQNNFYPGYPLVKRGIYYGSRMISSQYGSVFTKSHYEKLKKVYSIWICINPPKYRQCSVNLYSFYEKHLIGNVREKCSNYDLITVVMICLGDIDNENCQGLVRMLSVLFSTRMAVQEKSNILLDEFNIKMSTKIQKEVQDMCNYSDYVEQIGIEKGIEKGIEQEKAHIVKNMIFRGFQEQEIMTLVECDDKFIAKVKLS